MKIIFTFVLILSSQIALAQEFCDLGILNMVVRPLADITTNCSLLSLDKDQSFCRGVTTRNCSYISNYDDQMLCRALIFNQCSYASRLEDQEFCRGVNNRSCSYIRDYRQQQLCRGIINSACSYVDPEDYWLCVTLKDRR